MSFNIKAVLKNLSNDQEVEITRDKFTVGRSLRADYVLNSLDVSRIHFVIERREGIWILRDKSTNGTVINDRLIRSTTTNLNGDDVIKIRGGPIALKFILNTATTRFVSPNTAPVGSFIVSTVNGDNLPSVSNDHCYERRGQEEARTTAEGSFAISSARSATSSNTSVSVTTSGSQSLKRDRSPAVEESPKKNKTEDKPTSNCSDNFKEELECSVCQELFIKAVTLNCSHSFCNSCILKWKSQRNYCPICREPIKFISPSIALDNIIEKFVMEKDQESRDQRKQIVKDRLEEQNKRKFGDNNGRMNFLEVPLTGTTEVVCTLDQDERKLRLEHIQERLKLIESLKQSTVSSSTAPIVNQDMSTISVSDSPPELVSDSDDDWSEPEEDEEYVDEDVNDIIIDMLHDYDDMMDYY